MNPEMNVENNPLPYAALSDLTVIKEKSYSAETGLYDQVLRALPGGISAAPIITPFIDFPLDKPVNRWIKRALDILISIIVILGLLSWVIPLMALIIIIDSRGPVFFLQKRNKRGGAVFTCIKFRSMIVNEDADVLPAAKNDRRITRVGKFIRRNFIDELPQFFNVFMGDMSVIGPRPHMLSDNMRYEEEVEYYSHRLKIKPGITGLAQVMGYVGATDDLRKMKDRVNMDNFYLRHWSLRMDIIILFRTMTRTLGF